MSIDECFLACQMVIMWESQALPIARDQLPHPRAFALVWQGLLD
jgi:hypothetical protein